MTIANTQPGLRYAGTSGAEPNDRFEDAFSPRVGDVRIVCTDEAMDLDMPDAFEMQMGTELLVTTLFDVLRDTRLAPIADRLVWGIVHSFHKVAEQLDGQADQAARELREMIRDNDGSEIAAATMEDAQTICQGLDEAREAVACMRDHAADLYRIETGRPWSSPRGTLASSKRTASVIAASDFLAARRNRRNEAHAPSGPVVIFSGGQVWADHRKVWDRLDTIRARIPAMVLATTAQSKGCDAIAAAWAAANGVKIIAFSLERWRSLGRRAGFARNEALVRLNPAEAFVCEGNGLQSHLARLVRTAGIPAHFLKATGPTAS
jgi:hypothetical protein